MQNDLKWNNYLPILILIKVWQRFCSYGWTLSPKGRIGEVYIISNYFSCIYLCISHFHLQSYWVSKRKLIKKWKNRCFGVKNTVQCFSIKLKVTCQKSSHFWVKQKIDLKFDTRLLCSQPFSCVDHVFILKYMYHVKN